MFFFFFFFFSSRRRHTRCGRDWSSDVCSSDLFVHAGSDVVPAFTYYAHREKMRLVGKEQLLEEINRTALALAKEVASEHDALVAGDICNTNVFAGDEESRSAARAMFEEQVGWAADAGVDFVIGETFSYAEE